MDLDQATIDALKQKHGDTLLKYLKEGADGAPNLVLVFRKPSKVEWESFQDNLHRDQKSKSITIRGLASTCFVWPPDPAVAAKAFEDYPGIPTAMLDMFSKAVGLAGDNVEKL